MTARDYSSLQNVLSVMSLRRVRLTLDCFLDVPTVYHAFMQSTNNNFNIFSFRSQFSVVQSGASLLGNIRHNRGYSHLVRIDPIPEFDIVEYVQKFERTPARYFGVHCGNDEKWNQIKASCEQFTKSRKDYRFTLRRKIGEDSFRDLYVEDVHYNL